MLVHAVALAAVIAAAPPRKSTPLPAPLPSVAVFRLNPEFGVAQGVANLMSDRVAALLRDSGVFGRVVASADLENLVDLERQKQLSNCSSESCITELAGVLGVEYLVAGSMGKLGASFLINLKLLDVRKSITQASISERLLGDTEEALLDGSRPAVRKLLDVAGFKHSLQADDTALITARPIPAPVSAPASAPVGPTPAVAAAPASERPGWVFPVLGVSTLVVALGGLGVIAGVVAGAATAAFISVNSVVFINYPVDLGKGSERVGTLYVLYGAFVAVSVAIGLVGVGITAAGGLGAVVAALKL